MSVEDKMSLEGKAWYQEFQRKFGHPPKLHDPRIKSYLGIITAEKGSELLRARRICYITIAFLVVAVILWVAMGCKLIRCWEIYRKLSWIVSIGFVVGTTTILRSLIYIRRYGL